MAQVKLLKIASSLPTEHDGSADDLTVLTLSTDTINERTGASGVTIDSVVLLDGGVNLAASSNYQIDGTDIVADSAGTATLSNIDALDPTTEATIEAAIDTLANLTSAAALVTVSALSGGSITTTFGDIDNGTSNITTGGILKVDVDGTAIDAAGSFTYGTGNDAAIFWDGTDSVFAQTTALTSTITYNTLLHETSGTPANGIGVGIQFDQETTPGNNEKIAAIAARVTDFNAATEDAVIDIRLMIAGTAHALTATFDLDGLNLVTGDDYSIAGASVLTATTLGGAVVNSSLTSVGTLAGLTATGVIDFGGSTSVEIPSGTSVTVDAAGEIALDTDGDGSTVTHGVLKVFDGTDTIAIFGTKDTYPVSDNDVLSYDSGTNTVIWQAQTGGSDSDNEVYTNGNASSIVLGDVVYLESGVNDTVELADADMVAHGEQLVGIASETITASSTGNIHVARGKIIASVLTAATAGDIFYLSTTGTSTNTLTNTAPSGGPALVRVGIAKNATDLIFDPEFIADTTA